MLQGLMGGGGGGGGWTNLLGGLMGCGSTESAGGQQQGKYSKIGSLVGFGIGACFGGVGAPIGSMIGGMIGGFFDEQEAKNNVKKDKLRDAGCNVASDERMRMYASNGDVDGLINYMKLFREQELLNAGVRLEDIDALYANLREYDQGLNRYADFVCSMQRPHEYTGYADDRTSCWPTGFAGSTTGSNWTSESKMEFTRADGITSSYSRTDRLSISNGAASLNYAPIQFGNEHSRKLLIA